MLVALAAIDVVHRALILTTGIAPLVKDALGYWDLGGSIARGDLWLLEAQEIFRVPLYPLLVGAIRSGFGERALMALVIVQHLMGFLTSALAVWLAWRLTRSKLAALVVGVLGVLAVGRAWHAGTVMSETLFALLLTAAVVFLAEAFAGERSPRARLWWGLGAGAVLGLATLTRPVSQFLVILGMASSVGALMRRRWRLAAFESIVGVVFATGFLLALAPWLARNYLTFDSLSLNRGVGRSLWLAAFDPQGAGLPLPSAGMEASSIGAEMAARSGPLRDTWAMYEALREAGVPEISADDAMAALARGEIAAQPGRFSLSVLRRFAIFWYSTPTRSIRVDEIPFGVREPVAGQLGWGQTDLASSYGRALAFGYTSSPLPRLLLSLLAWTGAIVGLCGARTRSSSVVLLTVLMWIGALTAVIAIPLYRYRLIIEPLMTVALSLLIGRVFGRHRDC